MNTVVYDPSGVMVERWGLDREDLTRLAPRLERARDEVLSDARLWQSGGDVPVEKRPLDAGFIRLPERLLTEYHQQGDASEVARIQATADRLASEVDRVIVLGIGGSYMGTRALMESCCHPYHNLLDREGRGGRPRMFFAGNNVDNDATQGLLDLLRRDQTATGVDDRWAVVVISKSGGTLETAIALRQFLAPLRQACGNDTARLAELVVPVSGPTGRLSDLADALGCADRFAIPDGVGGRFSLLTAVGLLPAAILGLDIVALLKAAAIMNKRFETAPVAGNAVLDFAGVCHLMEQKRAAHTRVLSVWSQGLEAVGLWYDQLLAESLGKRGQGALPLTVVNTRDLHSRGQQHQQGRRDKLITNLIVEHPRRKILPVGHSQFDFDQLNDLADKGLPDIMAAAIAGTNRAYADDHRPTADIRLPHLSEAPVGQLLQMFMLATVVEGRLIGINPYGQPGVEAYKQHMNTLLGR